MTQHPSFQIQMIERTVYTITLEAPDPDTAVFMAKAVWVYAGAKAFAPMESRVEVTYTGDAS
jgi:hypothetical protein